MLKYFLIINMLLSISTYGQSYNRARTWIAKKPFKTEADIIATSRTNQEISLTTEYLDGYGRPVQIVQKQANPAQQDVITMHTYDASGREVQQYLPFASGNNGDVKTNAASLQTSFNQGMFPGETHFYSQLTIENSPLNRTLNTYAPGSSWAGSNRGTNIKYLLNSVIDEVRIWNVALTQGSLPVSNTTYSAGQLTKKLTKEEKNVQVIEYQDKAGKLIMRKTQLSAAADDGTGSPHAGWLCSYYVYDDYDRLRFILTPRVIELLNGSWTITQSISDELCIRMEYDDWDRNIIKKTPGADEQRFVYDKIGRLVMSQDGNLRNDKKWQYYKYDDLDRITASGLLTDPANYNNLTYHANLATSGTTHPVLASYTTIELSRNYYDNYSWVSGTGSGLSSSLDATHTSNTNYFYSAASANNYPYAQPITQSSLTRGMTTGTKIAVLGTSQFLYTVTFYDDKARIIQAQGTNLSNGVDKSTIQFNWAGAPLRTLEEHAKTSAPNPNHRVLTKMDYDHENRILNVKKTIESNINGTAFTTPEKTIFTQTYDATGHVKTKSFGLHPVSGLPLETQTFDYNLRGWITGINKLYTQAGNNANYFGLELGYDKQATTAGTTSFIPIYNSNAAGLIWKSKGDGIARKYDFTYDNANRLTTAPFLQNSSGSTWEKTNLDFSVNSIGYDYNGNIKSLNQNGFVLGGSPNIDNLTYKYLNNEQGNKLMNVIDNSNVASSKLGDFHYSVSKTPASIDYTYDFNGNKKSDVNKNISLITYNHLNLPSVISITGKGTISYTYDAAGNKLKKIVQENNAIVPFNGTNYTTNITTTTSYLGDFIYFSKTFSNTSLSSFNIPESLQQMAHEEGRARLVTLSAGNQSFAFDYFLKDHLGNIRITLTDELKEDVYPAATLETNGISTEKEFYGITNDASHIIATSSLPWFSAISGSNYQNNNGLSAPPDPTTNPTAASTKLYKLNGNTGDRFGMGIVLKVMSGDAISIFGKSVWHGNGQSVNNNDYPLAGVMASFLDAFAGTLAVAGKGVTGATLNATPGIAGPLSTWLSNNVPVPASGPKAYINWILLDEQFKQVTEGSYFDGVSSNPDIIKSHAITGINMPKSGYLYIYCSNESNQDVYFDNLQVVHTRGPLIEETHYYPQGLLMAALSSRAFGKLQNNWGYQSKEFQSSEFYDGTGLEEYDFDARYYDPQLSRWHVQDPVVNYTTPYAAMHNNPAAYIDPDGRDPLTIAIIAGVLMGGYAGYKIGEAKGATGWDMVGYIFKGAVIGGAAGYAGASVAAAGGFMANTFGIMISSTFNSMGMTVMSNGMVSPTMSLGFASLDMGTGEFNYLGKRGNSFLANVGFTFGALANVSDIVAGTHGTDVNLYSRRETPLGHSEIIGNYTTTNSSGVSTSQPISISVAPADPSLGGALPGLKWFMPYIRSQLQGKTLNGLNGTRMITTKFFKTSITNVNGKWLSTMTQRLNKNTNLLGLGRLKYGIMTGCVNYTARALFGAGVLNVNAFLPVTSPWLLQAEMALRQVGILASPFLVTQ
ncbi:DUF6443 domain-containing protein [Pseudobacter ginsenosidimutans]|uniref:RHS repeat-associated protein n=1 Tax=Pseudobacter ginsenosidimutans TaxID=661488 RepID=A0A4Q7MUG2_9BACT|nr:DUF6443 domain-containing protein [Pseudobacter ginsenosidimutans]QEC40970.1 hypothetical protein FSB84_04405 [Pseudobacter ginsenosidimutans]RZS72287.1 RHS repeat-associated protein [Pseudobacter ginsenosidimutans]